MDFRVEIADPAIDDLAEIVSYIAQDNAEAASTLGNHLLDAALSLAHTPHKGSPYRYIGNVRKLTVRQSVEVLRFWHSARREPKL
jgi:toxin ParE1/3/4